MYEIITYGGGSVLNGVFEAIARMRGVNAGSSLFSGLIIIAVLCGYIRTVLENAVNTNIRGAVLWALGWSIFLSLMYVQTVSITIVDRTLNQNKTIANVPFGIALFASLSSQISDFLTEEFETQFSVPDDFRSYRRSGSLFSEALVSTASRFEIVNPRTERNFRSFARQCIMYDVRIGSRYSLDELIYANNAWDLIRDRTSKLRMFDYDGVDGHQVYTCHAGAIHLNNDLRAEAERNLSILSWRFFGKSETDLGTDLFGDRKSQMVLQIVRDQLGPSHQFLTQMSGNATDILKQHMVRNAIKDSVIKNAGIVGASAAAQGFAVARAQEQQRNTFQILGDLSGKALANLTIVFQAILYASFMLIVLVVVQPNGFAFLRKYLGLVLWVQSWPPLFAIINYIQTEELRAASIAASTYINGEGQVGVGWNLFTSPAIIQANLDIAALAGFYSISVPLIAISLVQGVQSFLSLASHLGSVTQGAAGHAGEEMTTGNYSYGNVNLDNYSANNINANHWNTATTFSAMRSEWELSSGSTLSQMGDSSVALNQMSGGSQLMTSFRLSDMYSSSLQQQSQESQSALYSDGLSYASGMMDTASKAMHLAKSAGTTTSEGKHNVHGQNADISDARSKQTNISNRVMEEFGVTEDQSFQLMAAIGLDFSADFSTDKGGGKLPITVPQAIAKNLALKLVGSLGLKGTALSVATVQEAFKRTKDLMVSENATQSIGTTIRAAEEGHFNTGTDKNTRLSEDFRSSFDETKRHEHNYQASLQKVESLQESATYMKSASANVEQNLQQWTLDKVANLPDASGNPLGYAKADAIIKDPIVAKPYIDAIAKNHFMDLKNNYQQNAFSVQDLQKSHDKNSENIGGDSKIKLQNSKHHSEILEQSKELGVNAYDDTNISNSVQQQSQEILKSSKEAVDAGNSSLKSQETALKEKVAPRLNVNERGLARRVTANAMNRAFNLDDKK